MNVIIKGAVLVSVLFQKSEGIVIAKVLKLNHAVVAIPGRIKTFFFNRNMTLTTSLILLTIVMITLHSVQMIRTICH